jgi:natural product biosynthesis luciferase-like monooxygenase protein
MDTQTQPARPDVATTWPSFSLLFFSSEQADYSADKFTLFRRATRIADEKGFEAAWVPERHFHAFGGIFPNPSLLGVLLAESTENLRIRAGSVVLPLHSPIRVAEDWALVDNLSDGRVDLAFAVGWNPNDFVIAPQHFEDRVARTYEGIDTVKALWRGETITRPNGLGEPFDFRIYPLPRQKELTCWMTCSGGIERFREAGAGGFNILTALLFQTVDEMQPKLDAYREAWEAAGHEGRGHITLMLHTLVGEDEAETKETAREPFKAYLESSVDLWKGRSTRLEDLSERKYNDLMEFAFERYYRKTALMGTPESCTPMVQRLADAGVDEIACLIDFGAPEDAILDGMESLDRLRRGPAA